MMTTALLILLLACLTLFATASSSSSSEGRSHAIVRQVLAGVSVDALYGDSSDDDDDNNDSSSSSSSSSDGERQARIAAAIKAAVDVVEHDEAPAAVPYTNLRLRLATSSRARQCIFGCAGNTYATTTRAALQGVRAVVETTNGTFTATFNGTTGAAVLQDNQFQFTVTANVRVSDGALAGFTLSTTQSQISGFNITSLTLLTQDAGRSNSAAGQVYFSAFGSNSDFRNSSSGFSVDGRLRAVVGQSSYGCTPFTEPLGTSARDFAAVNNLGVNSIKITRANGSALVFNVATLPQSLSFTIENTFMFHSSAYAATVAAVGLEKLPCATRSGFLYDDVTIVTSVIGDGMLLNPFDNPSYYDSLKKATSTATPTMATFLRDLRQIAGRTQYKLRDAVIDKTSPFSLLSHWSKFTPCFRAYPDANYKIEAFIPMVRFNKTSTGLGGEVVRATLGFGLVGTRPGSSALQVLSPLATDYTDRPQFSVSELSFENLDRPGFNPVRPLVELPSDVYVILEDCPAFTYFQ